MSCDERAPHVRCCTTCHADREPLMDGVCCRVYYEIAYALKSKEDK